MALTEIAPSQFVASGYSVSAPLPTPARTIRDFGIAQKTRAALKLVPDLSVDNSASVDNGKFIMIIASIFVAGLLALLAINTSLTSGAFTMENMKLKLAAMNDQRDATLNQLAAYASPDQLAAHAKKLGMSAQESNNFVNVAEPQP